MEEKSTVHTSHLLKKLKINFIFLHKIDKTSGIARLRVILHIYTSLTKLAPFADCFR